MPNQLIRSRNGGRTFELRITHRALPKPVYRTFNSEVEARRAGQGALAALSRGEVPEWLHRADKNPVPTVEAAINAYLAAKSVPASTKAVLETVQSQIGQVRLEDVGYRWAENWIEALKLESRVTPGTIRKKVGALRRAFAWLTKSHPQSLASNPLEDLDHGYSSYNDRIRQALQSAGHEVPHDLERDRRVSEDEEQAIVAALVKFKDQAVKPEDRAHWEGLELMFVLALRTAMRMREIYTLTHDQLDIGGKTIHLRRTKSGSGRNVPLNSEALAVLSRDWPALREVCGEKHVLPFWQGDLDPKHLTDLTSQLSRDFARAVAAAGLDDLHFHDTRHEAICRWVLNARQPLSSETLGRAAGMKDQRTRMRYLSLRACEIADQLG